jgi:hypothetical protein
MKQRSFLGPAASNGVMMRILFAALAFQAIAGAAILPDTVGAFKKASASAVALSDRSLWNEYRLKGSETAAYKNGKSAFTATAYQLGDTTSALAVFDWQRQPKATPSKAASLAAETSDSLLVAQGNYVLLFSGYKPSADELKPILDSLKNLDTTTLPSLPGYLPAENLQPNSQRYVTGPVSLERFYPGITPSAAGFNYGAEAQLGSFRTPKGDLRLAIFEYPTHQIAMQKAGDLEKLQGALVKRSGPLVGVILSPADPDAAQKVLAQVRYEAAITLDEYVPTQKDNIGDLVLTAFVLIGLLLGVSIVAGLFVGGYRRWWAKIRGKEEPEVMTTLRLS